MHKTSMLRFCFGQLFKIVKNFSCQKICTIQKNVVPLHRNFGLSEQSILRSYLKDRRLDSFFKEIYIV